eukprot:jgi/Mesvir1/5016/Mv13901-RA.1
MHLVILADKVHHLLVRHVIAVAHVQAANIHPVIRQLEERLSCVAGRADGRHDLGFPATDGRAQLLEHEVVHLDDFLQVLEIVLGRVLLLLVRAVRVQILGTERRALLDHGDVQPAGAPSRAGLPDFLSFCRPPGLTSQRHPRDSRLGRGQLVTSDGPRASLPIHRPRYALQSSTGLHRPAQLPSLDGLIYSGRVVGHDGRMVKRVHTPAASPTGGTALGDPSTLPDWHKNVLSACSLHPASPAKDPAKEDPPASADSGGPDKSLKPVPTPSTTPTDPPPIPLTNSSTSPSTGDAQSPPPAASPSPPKDLRSWEDLGRIATEWWSGRSAPRKIPLSNTCQDALSWSQEAYFMLSDGTRAEFSQQHWHTAEEAIGQMYVLSSTEPRVGAGAGSSSHGGEKGDSGQHYSVATGSFSVTGDSCLFVDVGGSMLPFLSSLHLHHRNGSRIGTQCGIVAYEPSRSGFSTLQKAAIKANAWRKRAYVHRMGLGDRMERRPLFRQTDKPAMGGTFLPRGLGSMGPGPTGLGLVDVTTFDVEMEHAMGTQIVSGNAPIRLPAWTIVRVAAAGMEWEVLRGMQATLMVKGIAALAWNWSPRFSSSWVPGVLKAQAEFLASFGYAVYIVGINVSLRIDGPHWCPDPGADKQGCLMRHSMTLLAVVADPNSSLFRFMESRLLCRLVEPPPPASSPLPPSTTPPPTTTSLVPVVAATAATTTTAATPAVTGTGFVPGQRRMLLADDATPAVALAPGSNEAGPSQGEEQGQTQGQGQGQGQSQGRTQAERQADRHGASQAEASQALAVVVAAEPPRPDPLALVPSSSPPPAGVPEGSQCFCWRPKDATQLLAAEDTLHPKGGRGQKKKVFRGLGSGMVVGAWEELEVSDLKDIEEPGYGIPGSSPGGAAPGVRRRRRVAWSCIPSRSTSCVRWAGC